MNPLNGAGGDLLSRERGKDTETEGPPRGGGLWNPDGVGEGGIPVNCPVSKGGEEEHLWQPDRLGWREQVGSG